MPTYGSVSVGTCATGISSVTIGADNAANGVTETTIFSEVLPSGILGDTGATCHVRMQGIASATVVPPTLTLRLKYGVTSVCTVAAAPPSNAANLGWAYIADVTTRTVNTVHGQAWVLYPATPQGGHCGNTNARTIPTGGTVTVSITGQWGISTAGNTFTMTNTLINVGGNF